MRKIFLIIPAVFILILAVLGFWIYRNKYQPAAKTKEISVSPAELAEAEKIVNELFKGQPATASAGITVNNFSSVLTGNAAQNFRPDEKPVLINSPMGESYSFTKIVSGNKGLGITFEEWLKKQ